MLYVSMSQTTLCHTLLFSHLTASMNRSIHAVAVARTIRTYDLNSSFTRFRYFLFLPCDQDVDHQQSLTNRPPQQSYGVSYHFPFFSFQPLYILRSAVLLSRLHYNHVVILIPTGMADIFLMCSENVNMCGYTPP